MQIKNYNQLDLNKVVRTVKIIIPAQQAKMSPPVGPILGQVKVKIKDFCTLFNESTNGFKSGLPLRVFVFVFKNETFNFLIYTPVLFFLLKNHLAFSKRKYLTLLDVYKISLIKKLDIGFLELNVLFRNILFYIKTLKMEIKN